MSLIAAIAPAEHAPLAGRRVLIIEDEYFIADDITRAIASLGADVIGPVADVEEARRILDAGTRIDGALLDINVRNEMIFPLARALRSRNVPFVFATGYDKDVLGAEFHDVPVWEKPLDFPTVARSLANLIVGTR
jgi:DNA-binding response OmpR family regulator